MLLDLKSLTDLATSMYSTVRTVSETVERLQNINNGESGADSELLSSLLRIAMESRRQSAAIDISVRLTAAELCMAAYEQGPVPFTEIEIIKLIVVRSLLNKMAPAHAQAPDEFEDSECVGLDKYDLGHIADKQAEFIVIIGSLIEQCRVGEDEAQDLLRQSLFDAAALFRAIDQQCASEVFNAMASRLLIE